MRRLASAILIVLVAAAVSQAETDFFKKLKSDYAIIDQDLLNNPGEVGQVTNFVYKKDVATFTFTSGEMFFLRYVDNRPTTVIFIGQGHATVDLPSHVERQSMLFATGDTVVNEEFKVCMIRIGDDFDLRVREQFPLQQKVLSWKDFTVAKQAQGEFFFRPVIGHTYDNFFQLLRSTYDRGEDGYFFIDFNRFTFMYDPNRPEEVVVGYEKEGGDALITDAAVFQRKEHAVYDDTLMSAIPYPLTILHHDAAIHLSGAEGNVIDSAVADVTAVINADSVRFVNLFMHYNLDVDSIYVNDRRIDFHRRRDFTVMGLCLPDYTSAGDTVRLRVWYHGKNYLVMLPYAADPTAPTYKLVFTAPADFAYIMPGMGTPELIGRGRQKFTAEPGGPLGIFQFRAHSKAFTPVDVSTQSGLPITFLKSPYLDKNKFECFVPDHLYQPAVTGAFEFFTARLGNPVNVFGVTVFPEGPLAFPSHAEISQIHCLQDGTGGIQLVAGIQAARQWFGASLRPASDREVWVGDALSTYLGLMYTQTMTPNSPFFGELLYRRGQYMTILDRQRDRPLATGERVPDTLRAYKGAWVFHMLRQMMYDLEKKSDRTFLRFLQELASTINTRKFTNADIIRVAEKHAGANLDPFFSQWLYGIGVPEYGVSFAVVPEGSEWAVDVTVVTDKVSESFAMPVTFRIAHEDGTGTFTRQMISGKRSSFRLGPYSSKPREVVFNEYASVLAKEKKDKAKS